MKNPSGKAFRRAHIFRLKKKRSTYYGGWANSSPRQIGRIVHTATLCSCTMCGNARKYFKTCTHQESKQHERMKYELDEIDFLY